MNERNFHEVASVLREACDKETQQRNVLLEIFSVIESDAFEMLPQFLCEDVELHIYGMPVFAGSWRGYRAVTAAVAANFDKVDGQRPRVES
ncbi:MAG: hypothetical protein JNK48_00230, partial [Bryobacterales bacterium]|nr:hypothetical protein [Bryobacterales bacterium]